MSTYDYDLFVIGAGSGGVRASRMSAAYGARVAVVEERYLGGTCVNVGCIPKKLFVYAAEFRDHFEDAAGFGWSVGQRSVDWPTLVANKNVEIERLNGIYRNLLSNAGAEIIEGRARLVDPHTLAVDGRSYTAEHILVATGSWPYLPQIPGIEHAISSNEAFYLERLPQRAIIVGGGYIAVEFATIFHGLGVEVTELYRGELFLRGFDTDVRSVLAEEMRRREVDLRFKADIARIDRHNDTLTATLGDGTRLETDLIMYATGRLPNTHNIGLEAVGVEMNDIGAVTVDAYSRSTVPHIFAIGDCTDRLNLTPMAIAEGQAVAETLFHDRPTQPDHTNVATAVFSHPPIGTVGLTEDEARQRYSAIDVYTSSFRPLKHTLSGRSERTFMKLIVDQASDRVLGCHMVGPEAGEIIQGFSVALKCGATKAQFDATIGIHPTAAEEFVTMRTKQE
ncbi:MAG: glutathione-disulfide reductase [Desulfurellaceae bacterium]|nr:glutathione-disulfide reductase [Desulfurellaceae bacterium]